MLYIDINTKRIYTKYNLPSKDLSILRKVFGIYPRKTIEPKYDSRYEAITTESEGIEDNEYVIRFKKRKLSDDVLLQNVTNYCNKKIQEIAEKADKHLKSYLSQYSNIEQDTWNQQEEEIKNIDGKTPLIDALAENRNITKEEMAEKITKKIDYFNKVKIDVVTKAQKLREEVKNIKNSDILPSEKFKQIDDLIINFN